jgi:hypothetical protein
MIEGEEAPYGGMDRGVLQAIGLAVVNFSQLEETLAFGVTCFMLGTADDAPDLLVRQLSFRRILETFAGLYALRFGSRDGIEIKTLWKEIEKLEDERNHLVHSFWTPGQAADKLARYRKALRRGGPKTWDDTVSEPDLLAFAVRTEEVCGRVLGIVLDRILNQRRDHDPNSVGG